MVGGKLAVRHVPAKGRKLHHENHLGPRYVDNGRVVVYLAVDVADGHVAHDEDEADPRHIRAGTEVFGNGVGAASADEERDDAIPQIEQADEVEERYTLTRFRHMSQLGRYSNDNEAKSFSCGGAIYKMMKMFFRRGFESGRRLRIPASGYESRNENVNLTKAQVQLESQKKRLLSQKRSVFRSVRLTFVRRSRKLRRQRLESYTRVS